MKAMKAAVRSMSKGGIADALMKNAEGLKKGQVMKVIDSLTDLATAQVKKAGKFVIPGVVMLKTRHKPATKAGKRMMFGQKVKAKPARTIVKAFVLSALKSVV